MSILVTGGAGYIGSHCVHQLMSEGRSVVVYDNLTTGFKLLIRSPQFVQGDTRDRQHLAQVMKDYGVTAVMHFAASCYVGDSVQNPQFYYDNNVYGTLQLLAAMRDAEVEQIIFSSTCATYGVPQSVPLDETHSLNPINPYGMTKRTVEAMLSDFSLAYGLQYVSFRYFNAAGADPGGEIGECHDPETHLIPLVLQTASGQRPHITIYGTDYPTPDGTCIRDYIHVNDIAQAHLLGLSYLEQGGTSTVFNIGSEHGYSVREMISACEQVTGQRIAIQEGERRPGDPPRLVASAAKIKSTLGWRPAFTDLSAIIQTAWQWEQKRERVILETRETV